MTGRPAEGFEELCPEGPVAQLRPRPSQILSAPATALKRSRMQSPPSLKWQPRLSHMCCGRMQLSRAVPSKVGRWARGKEAAIGAWAMLRRHPQGPDVAENAVHAPNLWTLAADLSVISSSQGDDLEDIKRRATFW